MLMKYREAYKQFESDTYEDDEKMRKRQRTHRGENQQLPRRQQETHYDEQFSFHIDCVLFERLEQVTYSYIEHTQIKSNKLKESIEFV